MMKRKILCVAMSMCLVANLATASLATTSTFPDMPDNYATEALEYAVETGLLNGSDGMLLPTDNLTRAQMGAILVRAYAADELENIADYTDVLAAFADVDADAWYYDEIACAVHMGYFIGNDNGEMNPNNAITRQEAFVVLARVFGLEAADTSVLDIFPDASSVSDWAAGSVAAMVEAGLVIGNGEGVDPLGYITRQDFALVIFRALTEEAEEDDSSSSSSGGSSGGGGSSTYYNYTVDGTIDADVVGYTLELDHVDYDNYKSTNAGETIADVAKDLLDENESLILNAISGAMMKLYDDYEMTMSGYELVLSISDAGVISVELADYTDIKADINSALVSAAAQIAGLDADLTGLETDFAILAVGLASASEDELADTATEISEGAAALISDATAIIDGCDALIVTTAAVASLETLENLVADIEDYLADLESFVDDLNDLVDDINDFSAEAAGPAASAGATIPTLDTITIPTIPEIPEIPTLASYLDSAEDKYMASEATFIAKMNAALGFAMDETQETAAKAVYAVGNPTGMVSEIEDSDSLQMADSNAYYAILEEMVEKQCALWVALGDDLTDEDHYNDVLDVINGIAGIAVAIDFDVVTAQDGFFTAFDYETAIETVLTIDADLDASISKVLSQLGTGSDIANALPSLGNCAVTVTIERS